MSDLLERNLADLIRAGALPADAERARRAFLARAGAEPPRVPAGRVLAVIASVAACAVFVCSALFTVAPPPRALPPEPPDLPAPHAAGQATPAQAEGAAVPLPPGPNGMSVAYRLGPRLRLEGSAPLPDGAVLRVNLYRSAEQHSAGRLAAAYERAGGAYADLLGQRFRVELAWDQIPGPGMIAVDLSDHDQPLPVAEALRSKPPPARAWRFAFPWWGRELAFRLGDSLDRVDRCAAEALDVLKRFERACASEASWEAAKKGLALEGRRALDEVQRLEAGTICPAAVREIRCTLQLVVGNTENFHWEGGKFVARTYYTTDKVIPTHRGEAFDFAALRRYVEEAPSVAGREAALWAVREIRRGGDRGALGAFLRANAARAGLAPYAERLEMAAPEDLDPLEEEIRKR